MGMCRFLPHPSMVTTGSRQLAHHGKQPSPGFRRSKSTFGRMVATCDTYMGVFRILEGWGDIFVVSDTRAIYGTYRLEELRVKRGNYRLILFEIKIIPLVYPKPIPRISEYTHTNLVPQSPLHQPSFNLFALEPPSESSGNPLLFVPGSDMSLSS